MNVWLVDDHMGSCLITIGSTSIYLSNRTLLYHLESIAYISTIRLRYPRNWRSHKQRGTKRHLNLSSRLIIIIVHTNNSWRGWTCSEALFHQDMGDECQTSCSRGNGADIWLPQFTAYQIIEPERSLLEILVSLTQFAHYNKITLHWSSFKSVTSYKHLMENRWKTAQLNMRTTICPCHNKDDIDTLSKMWLIRETRELDNSWDVLHKFRRAR